MSAAGVKDDGWIDVPSATSANDGWIDVKQPEPPKPTGLINSILDASVRQNQADMLADKTSTLDALPPSAEFIGKSAKSGLLSMGGVAADLASDAYNLFGGVSKDELAVIDVMGRARGDMSLAHGEDPAKYTLGRIPEAIGDVLNKAASDTMKNLSEGSRAISSKEYLTLDPEKSVLFTPSKAVGDLLQSLPSSALLLVTSRFGGRAATTAREEALAAGATEAAANKAAVEAATKVITRTGAVGEGALGYEQQYDQTRNQVMELPQDKLDKSPEYKSLLDDGYDAKTARQLLAGRAGNLAGFAAALVDAGTNLASGPILGKVIGEGGNLLPRTGKAFATEATQEAVQSGGEQIAGNVATQAADPSQETMEGVPEAMAQGGVVGGLTGGAVGALAGGHGLSDEQREGLINRNDAAHLSKVFDAPDLNTAIQAASDMADGRSTETTHIDNIKAAKEVFDTSAADAQADKLKGLFERLGNGTVVQDDTGGYTLRQRDAEGKDVNIPVRVWDPASAPKTDTTISLELAEAQRAHYAEQGVDVVYFEHQPGISFDGVTDEAQPNTIFLSNDPSRNAVEIGGHEVKHVLEDTKTPDGRSLNDILVDLVIEGTTDYGKAHTQEVFGVNAPQREDFAEGADGDTEHAHAVQRFFANELSADIRAEAPKFPEYFPKVLDAIESRYGLSVARDMLQKFMTGVHATMETLRKFFGNDPDTKSQLMVNNLEKIHDVLAQMDAAKYGEELKARGLIQEKTAAGEAPKKELGTEYDDAKNKAGVYKRWLAELDEHRRTTAANSPVLARLRKNEASILAKVNGVETRLTRSAAARLSETRTMIQEHLNPVGDSADMAKVRAAMVAEHQRMADAASVSKFTKMSPRQEKTPEFKKWFGESKTVDEKNEPVVVYHGTSKDRDFNNINIPKNGAWFTEDPDAASSYATGNDSQGHRYEGGKFEPTNTAARVLPLYLKAEKPMIFEDPKPFNDEIYRLGGENYKRGQAMLFDKLRIQGYDSVALGKPGDRVWVALKNPTQLKSAIGNKGTFDETKKNIQFRPRQEYPVAPRSEWYGDADFEKRGGEIDHMTPDEFLRAARPLAMDETARDNIDDLKRHMTAGGRLDPLALYSNGKEDGRHRAIAAKELGIKKVPVINFRGKESGLKHSPRAKKTTISQPGKDVENKTAHGFAPSLRVRVINPPEFALDKKGAPASLMMQTTTNGNAERQIGHLDTILEKFPDAASSPAEWSKMMAYALGSDDVPIPPYAFIKDLNDGAAAKKVGSLSSGQISDANHGFEQAAAFREAYENGDIGVVTTGKLFLWSFLSRGVSPYVQEGLFIDAFDGAAPWIQRAADGEFTEADVPAYEAWARTAAPKGSGQPGAGATHNLNAFGSNFLLKMAERDAEGSSHLQRLHEMFSSKDMTGQQIRREFLKFGEGVGIDNKVVSFTLLVAGHSDVMVIDRVQTRQLWDDGRFEGINIYDGQKNDEGKVITGTPLANLTYGVRGLLAYEAIERGLAGKIKEIYTAAGRPQDASVGRYHWESWVAYSQQEASHGTLQAILDDSLKGQGANASAIAGVTAKQGEYGAYEYGALYGRDADNKPFFRYNVPGGRSHEFTVPAFRSFLEEIKKPATGVVPTKFKVTDSGNGPWYDRPEVDKGKLEAVASRWADRGGAQALRGAGRSADVSGGPGSADRSAQSDASGVKFSPRQRDERAFDATRRIRTDRAGDEGPSVSYTRRSREDGGKPRLLKSLGVTYSAEWEAGSNLEKIYNDAGVNVPHVYELASGDENNAKKFNEAITKAKAESEYGAAVAVYPAEDYKNFRLLLSEDGKSGAAIKPDGDIISVFSNAKSGHAMMEAAIAAGGRKLDAFDTILPKFYHMHGFVEAGRVAWDNDQAPEGWSKERFAKFNDGEPDVVLMVLDRSDMSPVLAKAPVFSTWDGAADAQERLLGIMNEAKPGAVINLRLDRLDGGRAFTMPEAKAVVEQTGAQVIASRVHDVPGAEGEPGVVMNLSRPLTAEEADRVATVLRQEAIPQFANGRGEIFGPSPEGYGAFNPTKFNSVVEGQQLHSPRVSPETQRKLKRLREDFVEKTRKEQEAKPAPEPKPFKTTPAAIVAEHAAEVSTLEAEGTKAAAPKPRAEPAPAPEPLPEPPTRSNRKALQPIEGTGREELRAINGETYNVGEEEPQMQKAEALVKKDRNRAIAIAMRWENPPNGVHPEFVYIALEDAARAADDADLTELLSRSPIAVEATTMGQRIAAWRNRADISPADDMRKIREARAERAGRKGVDVKADTSKAIAEGLANARKGAKSNKKPSLNDMIMSIICKV